MTTSSPAMAADAGFVPCALSGMSATVLCVSPRLSNHALSDKQAGILAVRSGEGGEADARKARDFAEHLLKLVQELQRALYGLVLTGRDGSG